MATIRNSSTGGPAKSTLKTGKVKVEETFVLPTKPTKQAADLSDYSVLIHGEKKIGKTSLALEPDPGEVLVVQFDPPQIAYDRMEVVCTTWLKFATTLKALEKLAREGKFPYSRVVIDRADVWFQLAQKEACQMLGISHPSEESWGKGWGAVRDVFNDSVTRVLNLPCGKWFICHSDWKEVEGRNGKVNKLVPNLNNTADEILNGRCDAWFAYAYRGKERVLICKGDERTGAGHRIKGHFRTTDDDAVEEIPMGSSPEEAWEAFLAAFNNELEHAVPPTVEDEEYSPQGRVHKILKNNDKKNK